MCGDLAWYNPFDRNTSEKRGLSRERDRKNVSETDGDRQGNGDGDGDGDGDHIGTVVRQGRTESGW